MHLPILCFDMDGTLLDEQGRIHPSDAKLLSSKNPPAMFIPSTGRPTDSVKRAFARSGLYTGHSVPLNMVLQNGALLMKEHEVVLDYDELEATIQTELLVLARGFPQVTFLFLSSTEIYVQWPNPFGLKLAGSFDFAVRPLCDANGATGFSKMMCLSESAADLDTIAKTLASWPLESALSMPTILEITNYGVNKGNGVKALLGSIGMGDQPFYAAGDWGNDLPLFQVATASFAPASAPEQIKTAATHVIDVRQGGLLGPMLEMIT